MLPACICFKDRYVHVCMYVYMYVCMPVELVDVLLASWCWCGRSRWPQKLWHTPPLHYFPPSPKSGCLYMYVCMYVCMYVQYVCMYVCMYVYMYVRSLILSPPLYFYESLVSMAKISHQTIPPCFVASS